MDPPEDWNDHGAWERYHATEAPHRKPTGSFGSFRPESTEGFRELLLNLHGVRSPIWVPGAGRSAFPAVLAAFGLEVFATDISPTAVACLRESPSHVDEWVTALRSSDLEPEPSQLHVELHDFREPYRSEAFARIFNIRAMQGFDRETMARVAGVHARALRPGGIAYFDTINVQDHGRDQLEGCLVEAGFTVPFHQQYRELRAELRATGIPYGEILGLPHVPQVDEYLDEKKRRAAQDRLRAIVVAARPRFEAVAEQMQAAVDAPERKLAVVIYSTG
jgi:hypothetical protein